MIAGSLEIQLLANVARLQQDMDAARGAVDRATRAMGTSVQVLRSAFVGLGSAMTLGVALNWIKGSIDQLDDLNDAAARTGLSIGEISKYQQLATAYGRDYEQIQAAIVRVTSQMGDKTSTTAQALAALGIKTRDAIGNLRNGGDVMGDIAKTLDKFRDGSNKVAIAQALMGKNGAAMLPFLKDYIDHFDEMKAVSEAAAQKANDFNDRLGELKLAAQNAGQNMATALLPAATRFVTAMVDATHAVGKTGDEIDNFAQDTGLLSWANSTAVGVARLVDVISTIPKAAEAVKGSFDVVGQDISTGLFKSGANYLQFLFPKSAGALKSTVDDLVAQRKAVLDEANKRYADLWSGQGNKYEQAVLNSIAVQQGQQMRDPRLEALMGNLGSGGDKPNAPKLSTKSNSALADAKRLLEQFEQLQAQINGKSAGLDSGFYKSLELIATQGAKAGLTLQQIINLQGKYIQQQPFAVQLEQEKAKAAQTALDLQLKAAQAQLDVQSKLRAAQGLPQSRADIARQYDDQRSLFIAQGNTSALGSLDKLINTQAAQAQFEALSKTWQQATGGMTAALDLLKAKADSGLITQQAYAQSVADLQKQVSPSLAALLPQLQSVAGALGPEAQATVQQYAAALVRLQNQVNPVLQALGNSIETNFGNAFADMVTGAKSAKEAFSSMATSILSDMARLFAQRAASNLIGSLFGGFGGGAVSLNAAGGIYNSPSLSAYSGTVVDKPTLFAFAHGAGLMGEAGAEAILPLRRGSDGKLGVQAQGAATQSISVSVAVDARGTQVSSDSAQGQKVGVQLANVVKAVIINEMRPGGALAGVK